MDMQQTQPQSNGRPLLFLLGCLIAFGCAGCLSIGIYAFIASNKLAEEREAKFGALRALCEAENPTQAEGVAAAALYDKATGLHPIVIFEDDGSEKALAFSNYPTEWEPADLASTQLVACLEPLDKEQLSNCDYYDTDSSGKLTGTPTYLERYQYKQRVILFEAQSGKVLGKQLLRGGNPDTCPDNLTFEDGETVITWEGDKVSSEMIQEWLNPFVNVGQSKATATP